MDRPSKDALIRHFLGKSAPHEDAAIDAFLAMNIADEYIESCMKEALDLQEEVPVENGDFGQERVWLKLSAKQRAFSVSHKMYPGRYMRRYVAAAVAVLILGIGIIFYLNNLSNTVNSTGIAWRQIRAEIGNPKSVLLADGSTIALFPGSVLDIPEDFNLNTRTIRLTGRAYFTVTKNAKKRFQVTTPGLTTTVLGTSFEVNAGETESMVILHSGKVSVADGNKELAKLEPNQQIRYDQETNQFDVTQVDAEKTLGWVNGELDFDRVPLKSVFGDVGKWYGVTIHVESEALASQRVVFSFKDQSLDRVLSLLSKSANFTYEIQGNNVYIKEGRAMNDGP